MKQRGLSDSELRRTVCLRGVLVFLFISLVVIPTSQNRALAAIPAGIPCSSCHTMHNSQDGSSVFAGGPQEALLNNDCIGCHSGSNSGSGLYPNVFDPNGVTYGTDTLAGGNFFWVTTNDATGHNVEGVAANIDQTIPTPPGFNGSLFTANGSLSGGTWGSTERLTCAGTNGCHGRHNDGAEIVSMVEAVKGGHHGIDTTIDGSSVAKSYRFLYGIIGIEDPDWELTASDGSTDHNQYHGIDGGTDSRTISYLCAECHGTFHTGEGSEDGSSPWLRHPVDFDMNNVASKEFGGYNGINNPYSVTAPVASNLDTVDGVLANVFQVGDDAIVSCISCHRAHGSPYYKLMRWDYANSTGGDCAICHTSKS